MAAPFEVAMKHADNPSNVESKVDMKLDSMARPAIKLSWKGVNYKVPIAATSDDAAKEPGMSESGTQVYKTLLHSMSGEVRPTEMMAIMGSSGAGKSTLLDVLAGRVVSEGLDGTVLANDAPTDDSFKRISGYVMQSDALFPTLTVTETFTFAARLRSSDQTDASIAATVKATIDSLRLEKAANTVVGNDQLRGLSGGERRRVQIGVDTIHQPQVIFLDEPTSGLDSSTALTIVENLKHLAGRSRTIICTIHQPSAKVFNLFDKVVFLHRGHVVYSGMVDDLEHHVHSTGELLGVDVPRFSVLPELLLEMVDKAAADGRDAELIQDTNAPDDKIVHSLSLTKGDRPEFANDAYTEAMILTKRSMAVLLKTPDLFTVKLVLSLQFGLLMGSLFYDLDDDEKGVRDLAGGLAFLVAFVLYNALESIPIFASEKEIFRREYSRGAYRASSYVWASTVVFIPAMILNTILFSTPFYFLVGLDNDAGEFFFLMLVLFLTMMLGHCFAVWISSVIDDPLASSSAGSAILSMAFLMSGFFIVREDIPPWWIWAHYLSCFKYPQDSLLINSLNDSQLEQFNLANTSRWVGVGALVLMTVLLRLLFYYQLITKNAGLRE